MNGQKGVKGSVLMIEGQIRKIGSLQLKQVYAVMENIENTCMEKSRKNLKNCSGHRKPGNFTFSQSEVLLKLFGRAYPQTSLKFFRPATELYIGSRKSHGKFRVFSWKFFCMFPAEVIRHFSGFSPIFPTVPPKTQALPPPMKINFLNSWRKGLSFDKVSLCLFENFSFWKHL